MRLKRSDRNEYYDAVQGPLGKVYLVFSSSTLIGISFERPSHIVFRQTRSSAAACRELSEYFSGDRSAFSVKTAFTEGTEFEKKVWNMLKEVPFGETRTYKWIADRIGKPHAFRAVGHALGKNPIPIVFPCHRIIESDGSIGGYSSGVDIKRRLLEIEYYTKLARA
jgi:methylated-DNA-[protein]-cysteine S-methyltransferase